MKYLGAPIHQGRLTLNVYDPIIHQIRQKLETWRGKLLSQGGRLILLRHVLSSLPIYLLLVLNIPDKVLNILNSLMSNFFWGISEFGLRRHWVSWQSICKPIEEEGIGLRLFKDVRKVMQLKLGWRLLNVNSKWSDFCKAKYAIRGKGHLSFWIKSWSSPGCLKDMVFDIINPNLKVSDIFHNGVWNLQLMEELLGNELVATAVAGIIIRQGNVDRRW
ncbi:hypothetical protein REPUB_Repub14bG0009100 [Reevesia pubescens]